jgi:hypothetical protein
MGSLEAGTPEQLVDDRRRVTGTTGVVVAVAVGVLLGGHPLGSTDLYNDGPRFTHHVGYFWVTIHFLGALLLLAVPAVVSAASDAMLRPAAQVFGRIATSVSIGGVALAVLHLAGTDTTTFLTYENTLNSGIEGATAGADVLLRVHAATLTAFVLTLFVALPAAFAVATALERDWTWRFWLPVATSVVATASLCVTLAERQWTTTSEMGLLRPAMVLFLVWFGLVSYRLRRIGGEARPGCCADEGSKPDATSALNAQLRTCRGEVRGG